MSGKSLNKEEFVTCGGVRLSEVNFKTMESRLCPGLYFAGELLDIDGITGGFGTLYGAYAAKNANDYGRAGTMSTIVVQNLGGTATTPTLEFTPLGGGATRPRVPGVF